MQVDTLAEGKEVRLGSPGFKPSVLSGSKSRLFQAAGTRGPYCVLA